MSTAFSERQLTLGELIAALKTCDPKSDVRFDFCYFAPRGVDSYRGFYDHLALSWAENGTMTVAALLKDLERAVDATFQGYKGGDYRMDNDTPMWVANYGAAGSTAVVGVQNCEWLTVIETAHVNV